MENKIIEFLTRGVENIYPNKEFVEKLLNEKRRLRVYLGIDPTGPTLHFGHAIPLRKLKELQDMGHEIILLIGDFTALSGDPDKTEVRERLTPQKVKENARLYKKQASLFLSFSGRNKAKLKHNNKWLSKLTFSGVIQLASHFTVEQMIKRDLFKRRIEKGVPLYIHEFMYPLMQGYDSVAMDVDGEIGGNDQTFNMLAGRTLLKQIKNKEKFVITTKLFADKEGKKMGKTTGNMVTFEDTPSDMFGKIMSWSDDMIIPGFELLTFVSEEEIERVTKDFESGVNPKELKIQLAKEIVSFYHNTQAAEDAHSDFENTFKDGGVPEEIETYNTKKGTPLCDVLVDAGLVESRSQYSRLVEQGAIKILETNEKVGDRDHTISQGGVYKIGKTRFIKITLS